MSSQKTRPAFQMGTGSGPSCNSSPAPCSLSTWESSGAWSSASMPVPQEPILQTQRKFWRLVADQPNYSLSELVAERFLSLSLSLDKSAIQENKQSLEREREREICFWLFFLGIRQKCVVYYL